MKHSLILVGGVLALLTGCAHWHVPAPEARGNPTPPVHVLRAETDHKNVVKQRARRHRKRPAEVEADPLFGTVPADIREAVRRLAKVPEGIKVGEFFDFLGLKRAPRNILDGNWTDEAHHRQAVQYEIGYDRHFLVNCELPPTPEDEQSWDQAELLGAKIFQVEYGEGRQGVDLPGATESAGVQSSRVLGEWKKKEPRHGKPKKAMESRAKS